MRLKAVAAVLGILTSHAAFAQETSTWQTIPKQIFDRQCVSCHAAGTYFARQSGLVADLALLQDTTRYQIPAFAPLPKPADGIQLHVNFKFE